MSGAPNSPRRHASRMSRRSSATGFCHEDAASDGPHVRPGDAYHGTQQQQQHHHHSDGADGIGAQAAVSVPLTKFSSSPGLLFGGGRADDDGCAAVSADAQARHVSFQQCSSDVSRADVGVVGMNDDESYPLSMFHAATNTGAGAKQAVCAGATDAGAKQGSAAIEADATDADGSGVAAAAAGTGGGAGGGASLGSLSLGSLDLSGIEHLDVEAVRPHLARLKLLAKVGHSRADCMSLAT
eukprot:61541-Chlamydomonas_euryale.AAC.1